MISERRTVARRMRRDRAEKKTSAHLLVLFTFISGISMQVSRRAVAKMPSDAFLCDERTCKL